MKYNQFLVSLIENGMVDTHMIGVKFEGISYNKRVRNVSASSSIIFKVENFSNTADLDFKWFFDGVSIPVKRYTDDTIPKESIYSTETVQSVNNANQLKLILHLNAGMLLLFY